MISSVYASVNLFNCVSRLCFVSIPHLWAPIWKRVFGMKLMQEMKERQRKTHQYPNTRFAKTMKLTAKIIKARLNKFISVSQLTISMLKFRSLKMQSEHVKSECSAKAFVIDIFRGDDDEFLLFCCCLVFVACCLLLVASEAWTSPLKHDIHYAPRSFFMMMTMMMKSYQMAFFNIHTNKWRGNRTKINAHL